MNLRRRWLCLACGLSVVLASGIVAPAVARWRWVDAIAPTLANSIRQPATPPGEPAGFLVSVGRQGGFCLPPGCLSEVTIFADGTYQYANPPAPLTHGRISGADLRLLKWRIAQTDFAALRQAQPAAPMPDLCLLPVDGPEAIYTFWTGTGNGLPAENRFEQIRGCETAVDTNNALFQQLERLYHQLSAQVVPPPASQELPEQVAAALQAALLQDYQNRLANVRVASTAAVVWQACLPLASRGQAGRDCQIQALPGWRVVMTGEFPSLGESIERVYYVDAPGSLIVADAVGSLTETRQGALLAKAAEQLALPLEQLRFLAAEEEAFYPAAACPDSGFCPIAPLGLSWRVLVEAQGVERLVDVSSLGQPLHTADSEAFFSAADGLEMPVAAANAVVRDAQARILSGEIVPPLDLLTGEPTGEPTGAEIDFQVESIRAVSWHGCGSGGPTQPAMGNCPDVTMTGWQIIVTGGLEQAPLRLVYYLPEPVDAQTFVPQPDGMQSLPEGMRDRVLAAAAADSGLPAAELRVRWVEPRWFDACLGVALQEVGCRNGVRPGWQVEVVAAQAVGGSWAMPLWTYHANLTGTELELVRRGEWAPPPAAAGGR